MSKVISVFKKAPFPAAMTVISFLLFIFLYNFEIISAINPNYTNVLICVGLVSCFGIITFFSAKEKLDFIVSYAITGVLFIGFCFPMIYIIIFSAFEQATTITDSIGKDEKVLKVTGDSLTESFLKKNPKNIEFYYSPVFMQEEEEFDLEFQVDSD